MKMGNLTPNEVNKRNDFLLACIKKYGRKTVLGWAKDERKRSIINAMFAGART